MKHIFLIVGIVVTGAACSTPSTLQQTPFQCLAEDACPKGACTMRISLNDSCAGQVAEVLLNGALEPTTLTSGSNFSSVGQIPAGITACSDDDDCNAGMVCSETVCKSIAWIRSEDWQWGPFYFECSDPDEDGTLPTLSCPELCGNGKDDDGDQKIDCQDDDCSGRSGCGGAGKGFDTGTGE